MNRHVVDTGPVESAEGGWLGRWRLAGGWLLVVGGLPVLTAVLVAARDSRSDLSLQSMCFLSLTVLAALVGGRWPGLVGALSAALLLNYFFTPPVHTLTVDQAPDVLTLVVFLVTAVAVSAVVDAAARRREQATAAEREAATLAMLNRRVLGGTYDVPALLALARDTFGARAADLVS